MLPLFFLFSLLAATARCKSILKLLLNIYLFDIPTRRLTGSPRYAHPAFSISSQLCSCCLPSQPRSQHSFIYLSRSLAVFEPSIAWLFLSLGLFTTLYILQIIRLSPSIPATIIAYQVPAVITYLLSEPTIHRLISQNLQPLRTPPTSTNSSTRRDLATRTLSLKFSQFAV